MNLSNAALTGLTAAGFVIAMVAWAGTAVLSGPPEAQPAPPPAVRVAVPTVEPIQETVRYLATIEGQRDATLAFRVPGTIEAMHVREGQAVEAGQRLATLDAPETRDRIDRAQAEFARASATADHWRQELAIDERLYAKGAIAKTKRDQTDLQLSNAQDERDAAAARLQEAEHAASNHVLTASQPGVIGQLNHEPGETVGPGEPVVQLNAGTRQLRMDVLAQDQRRGIEQGSEVHISACAEANKLSSTRADTEATSIGTVTEIETATRPPFESVRVYATLPENCLASWPTGSTVSARVVLRQVEDALLVPQAAIDRRGDRPRVFRITADTTAEAVAVRPGLRAGDLQHVSGALRSDDRIVVTGTSRLTPGTRVHVDTLSSTSPTL